MTTTGGQHGRGGQQDGSRRGGVNAQRRCTVRALAPEVQRVAHAALGRHSQAEAALLTAWPSIVGREIAGLCRPLRITFPTRSHRRDGTLEVRVPSAQAVRLKHLEPLVVERVNAWFGYTAVAALRLHHAPLDDATDTTPPRPRPADPPSETARAEAGTIPNPELRAALARLGTTLGGR
jgi:hypothetical protein